MNPILIGIANARKEAIVRREGFARIPMTLLADIVAELMGRETSDGKPGKSGKGRASKGK